MTVGAGTGFATNGTVRRGAAMVGASSMLSSGVIPWKESRFPARIALQTTLAASEVLRHEGGRAMTDRPAPTPSRALWAFVGPFAVFIALQSLPGLVKSSSPTAAWFLRSPEFWVYPLQTLVCGIMMLRYRRDYPHAMSARAAVFGLFIGAVVFALWISPQAVFGFAPRIKDGFDPTPLLAADRSAYFLVVALRFVRLAVVVPWLEEIFWRGFCCAIS